MLNGHGYRNSTIPFVLKHGELRLCLGSRKMSQKLHYEELHMYVLKG
jgi:hypothetical protein